MRKNGIIVVVLSLMAVFKVHAMVPYIGSGSSDAAVTTPGTYEGFLYQGGQENGIVEVEPFPIEGSISLKLSNLKGKMSLKLLLAQRTLSFSFKEWELAEDGVTMKASQITKSGEYLEIFVRQNRIWGGIVGGSVGPKLWITGARNRFAEKNDDLAQHVIQHYTGYYTFILQSISAAYTGDLGVYPTGYGYLTATINKKGKVNIAGMLADGTRVSRSGTLLWITSQYDPRMLVCLSPRNSKTVSFGGLIELQGRSLSGAFAWLNMGRDILQDGFLINVLGSGGLYQKPPTLEPGYNMYLDVGSKMPDFYAGKDGFIAPSYIPDEFSLSVNRLKLVAPKGVAPKKVGSKAEGFWYDYGASPNPSQLTLNFAPNTGIFKGRYKVYYDYTDARGGLKHKTVTVPYAGVMLQDESGKITTGLGYTLLPDNDPFIKQYKIKWSTGVALWQVVAP